MRERGREEEKKKGKERVGEEVNVLILLIRNHCSIFSGKWNIFPRFYNYDREVLGKKLNTDENLNYFGDYHVSTIAMTIITHICVTDCTVIRKQIIHIQDKKQLPV